MAPHKRYAYWAAWSTFAHNARVHLTTLDPRTDWLAIARWLSRWRRATDRANEARDAFDRAVFRGRVN